MYIPTRVEKTGGGEGVVENFAKIPEMVRLFRKN
jgi:hypothetical protein